MTRGYSQDEMRRYWRVHSRLWADLDREKDPEGLTNVCYSGAPLWLNRFAAQCQKRVFLGLMHAIRSIEGARTLDVGCGVGRWSRLLSGLGAHVTGIDLQPETLRDNRLRLPACRFLEMDATALAFADASFDIATSVTVLQHLPDDAQGLALAEIRRVLTRGSPLILLEGIRDRGDDVFGQGIEAWHRKAREAGFLPERTLFYDYAPLLYALRAVAKTIVDARMDDAQAITVDESVARFRRGPEARGFARRTYRLILRGATMASYPIEPILMRIGPSAWAHHAGFLLRAA